MEFGGKKSVIKLRKMRRIEWDQERTVLATGSALTSISISRWAISVHFLQTAFIPLDSARVFKKIEPKNVQFGPAEGLEFQFWKMHLFAPPGGQIPNYTFWKNQVFP